MRVAAGVLGVAVVIGAVAPAEAGAAADQQHPVGVRTVTLVDADRATPPNGSFPGSPTRSLATRIYYPAVDTVTAGELLDDAPVAKGRFPLVVFGHGSGGTNRTHERLLAQVASEGYVVAAPSFPLSRLDAPGGSTNDDRAQQAGDLSFLVSEVPQLDWLEGHVDDARVAVGGHSLGAYSALQAGYSARDADERVDAVISLAGLGYGEPDGVADDATPPTLLLVHGRRDPEVPYALSEQAFEDAEGPRVLVSLRGEDPAAPHLVPYVGGRSARARTATAAVVDFLAWRLRGDDDALARLRRDVRRTGVGSVDVAGSTRSG